MKKIDWEIKARYGVTLVSDNATDEEIYIALSKDIMKNLCWKYKENMKSKLTFL